MKVTVGSLMADGFLLSQTTIMKKILLTLVLAVLSTAAHSQSVKTFTLVGSPGIIFKDRLVVHLKCDCNKEDVCDFPLTLPVGWYFYANSRDTFKLVVTKNEAYLYNPNRNDRGENYIAF